MWIVVLVLLSGVVGFYFSNLNTTVRRQDDIKNVANENTGNCIPTFKDGGGPYYKPNSPFREKIVQDTSNGDRLIVSGKILKNDCVTPISNAVLDIWQANEKGVYEDLWYRGQVRADKNGIYKFETIIPKGYGEGTGYRPPHIHFKVFIENEDIITSQMFFPEVKGTPGFDDAFIIKIESTEENGKKLYRGTHNIILP